MARIHRVWYASLVRKRYLCNVMILVIWIKIVVLKSGVIIEIKPKTGCYSEVITKKINKQTKQNKQTKSKQTNERKETTITKNNNWAEFSKIPQAKCKI